MRWTIRTVNGLFRNFPLKHKIVTICMISVVFACLLSSILVNSLATRIILANCATMVERYTAQIESRVLTSANEIERAVTYLLSQQRLISQLKNEPNSMREELWDEYNRRLQAQLELIVPALEGLNWAAIRDNNGQYIFWQSPGGTGDQGTLIWQQLAKGARYIRAKNSDRVWFCALRTGLSICYQQIIYDNAGEEIGTAVFNFDSATLSGGLPGDGLGRTLVIDSYREIVFAERFIDRQVFSPAKSAEVSKGQVALDGVDYIVRMRLVEPLGWTIAYLADKDALLGDTIWLSVVLMFSCVVTCALAFALSDRMSMSIERKLRRLREGMSRMGEGDLSVHTGQTGGDELEEVNRLFDRMVKKLGEQIVARQRAEMARGSAEYEVLLAQVNPHFLYNTLGSIRWLAHKRNEPEVEKMTANLIALMQMSIKNGGGYWSVSDELKYVQMYVELQQYRFQNAFEVCYNVDQSLLNARILGFMLQPIVENALYHGVDIAKGGGVISISIQRDGKDIEMTVKDDGAGMDAQTLERLLNEPKQQGRGMNSIGLYSINRRLMMHFGTYYALEIKSILGEGSTIALKQPLKEDEQ